MRPQQTLVELSVLVLVNLLAYSLACSDVILSPKNQVPGQPALDAAVSARHLDWYPLDTQPIDVVSIPAGTQLNSLPAGSGCNEGSDNKARKAKLLTAKHGFVCFTVGYEVLQDAFKKVCPGVSLTQWPAYCFDGMNTAGLSVGSNAHPSAPRVGYYAPQPQDASSPSSPDSCSVSEDQQCSPAEGPTTSFRKDDKTTFVWHELPHVILANYATVAEVAEAFKQDKTRFAASEAVDRVASAILGTGFTEGPMLHFIIHDKTGATGVIEAFSTQDGTVSWQFKDNPSGVTTNAPALEELLQYVKDWKSKNVARYGSVNGSLILPGHCSGPEGAIDGPTAPYCDSVFRFAHLALIKEATFAFFPNPKFPLNPLASSDPSHAAYSAVIALISRVLVPGSWPQPKSNTYAHTEATVLQLIRDHKKGLYFFRHYGNMQWAELSVERVARLKSSTKGSLALASLADLLPVSTQWAVNKVDAFASAARAA